MIKFSRLFNGIQNQIRYTKLYLTVPYSNQHILGIETSADDTGCAIVNNKGELLAESLHSQNLIHLRNGGIIPDVAQDLHRTYIKPIVSETLRKATMSMEDISAIAVTLKPGLPLSLVVGMKYAKHLARRFNKPIIPIHHMEAHALTARMYYNIPFPFLVLLISGGHCLLAVAQDVNHFQLLGQSIDSAPGEIFDKVARKMKLRNISEYSKISGGKAIELAASKATNPHMFKLPLPLAEYKDCNFSFNGLKTSVLLQLHRKEKQHEIIADKLIPEVNDLCAAMLMAASRHLIHRTQRAMEFCEKNNLIPESNKQLIVSGGVACNNYIFNALTMLCDETNYKIYRPPPKLCTDNGVMIAWNGLEKWRKGLDITTDIKTLDIEAVSPLDIAMRRAR
ncbi:probable tRNA N6-adenosine threonylcarbamoyltransferase, mitochondrial [Hyposmocoma kahamanoa]|uniref:probable tRNA N6-adenosine threonylcarbamoyltransferase, mitochondrial n=1 Tax=Hyposmocoma kahamanoa TaxID=1477025 RepID=UPI000E6D796F|nr:probable tRNA N6-adenosine threonylcarbamoyltransferase, mitochondrial [Hyposmocoma kahamanoa]